MEGTLEGDDTDLCFGHVLHFEAQELSILSKAKRRFTERERSSLSVSLVRASACIGQLWPDLGLPYSAARS